MTLWHKVCGGAGRSSLAVVAAGCGGSGSESKEVVLVTHDSFAIPKEVKAAFEQESGLKLTILQGGDAGEMVNRALLTKGNPQGDVALRDRQQPALAGARRGAVRAVQPRTGSISSDARYRIDPSHAVTPIDHGDVCLNVDRKWFASHGVAPPRTLADLTDPRYRNLLVVENPATSTPGLAFMLATIAKFGESGWQDYWRRLRANGVLAVDGWEEAYTARFSGAGGSKGKRPIVVSYATSPAAEVIFAKTPPTTAPTAVVADSCFRQIELAGVLDGARNEKGARAFIDFMLAEQFQAVDAGEHVRAARARRHAASGGVPEVRRLTAESARAARGRDRQQPRSLDRRVDTGRPALRRGAQLATIAVPAAFLALFFAFPLAAILERGLTSAGGLSLPAGTAGLVWFTVWQAAASTVLTLVAGLPLAWAIGRFRFRGRALARALVLVPFVLPTVVVATAFLAVLPDGYERGLWAILAAHVFFNVAVVTRIVGGAWAAIDPRSAEAAAVLGAGPLRRAREITLPQLAPAISAASALTFLFCFTSFGVILILGGPGRATVETEIYNRAARLFDLQAAAALSLLQLGAVAVVLTVAGILEARAGGAATLADENDVLRRPRGWERLAVVGVLGAGALALLFPLAVLVRAIAGQLGRALRDDSCAPGRAVGGGRVLRRVRKRCRGDRPRRRWARGRRPGAAARRRRRRLRAAPPRRLGRDARLRVPDRVRRGTTRLPVVVVARPRRPVAHRGAVRRPDRHARTPVDRPGVARGGGDARRIPAAEPARDRRAARRPGVRRRGRVRVRDRARGVRRHRLRGEGRATDAARGDLPVPRPPR